MMSHTELEALISPLMTELGLTLWGMEFRSQPGASLLCLYVDKPGGITIADCELVSRQVNALLDVEWSTTRRYRLEVSSPGIPRPLFKASQYGEYVGHIVSLKLNRLLNGTRKITGKIEKVTAEQVEVQMGESLLMIPFSQIVKAQLVGERGEP